MDDFVMRQIQKIADMLTAIAGSASGRVPEGMLDEILDAYRDLLGMDADLADSLDAETLLRGLHSEQERDALIDLTLAHAEVCARTGDASGARRRFSRALALMAEGDERTEAALERLVEL